MTNPVLLFASVYDEYERESYRLLQEQIAQIPGDRLPHQVRQAANVQTVRSTVDDLLYDAVLQIRGPAFFAPWIRYGKKSGTGIRDEQLR